HGRRPDKGAGSVSRPRTGNGTGTTFFRSRHFLDTIFSTPQNACRQNRHERRCPSPAGVALLVGRPLGCNPPRDRHEAGTADLRRPGYAEENGGEMVSAGQAGRGFGPAQLFRGRAPVGPSSVAIRYLDHVRPAQELLPPGRGKPAFADSW